MFKGKPRYRHARLKARRNKALFRCRVVPPAAVAANKPHPQFLIIRSITWCPPILVDTSCRSHSIAKGAGKFAFTY